MKDSVLRAQGRFGALHHPPPSLACRPAHKQEVADDRDRQPGLHRLPQRRYRLAGQPRVFGLRGRIDRKRPLRIVGDVEGKLGQADVSEPMIEGRRRADRKGPVDQPMPEAMCLGTMSPERLKAVSIQPRRWKASGGGGIL